LQGLPGGSSPHEQDFVHGVTGVGTGKGSREAAE
jgi:hypothetical protein